MQKFYPMKHRIRKISKALNMSLEEISQETQIPIEFLRYPDTRPLKPMSVHFQTLRSRVPKEIWADTVGDLNFRGCLKCDKMFLSLARNNRICHRCQAYRAIHEETETYGVQGAVFDS